MTEAAPYGAASDAPPFPGAGRAAQDSDSWRRLYSVMSVQLIR